MSIHTKFHPVINNSREDADFKFDAAKGELVPTINY